ncbi:winged helix-turn-helix transcriptional regulator [Lacticaseibacillus chiayiensis]|uniref:winged helix-turn-helix transcriptional regulator n=1 Tax=Lacticaseibacillus chiayiensis TaxID=2100821 RepID=UPI0010123777|nr:helix-turn-helix domain-containing protein [Lacticaseibacillus chiayiensis]RXT58075.1 MarR family transcriptional regulator [Lacticaseibacillus chiayiensis]
MRTITPVENSRRHDEFCPLDTAISILAGKWKSIIICRLMDAPLRFSELQRTMSGCTNRMLAMQLNELEEDKIIFRQDGENHPCYALTSVGKTMVPIIRAMNDWGRAYLKQMNKATISA